MMSFIKTNVLIGILFALSPNVLNAQTAEATTDTEKAYKSLEEALKSPDKVYRLDLSNQQFKTLPDSTWSKFKNLEYLSLKNDHLSEIPRGIGNLKNLRVLDLSGNDFKVLPQSFSKLLNLSEIYLNDEKEMNYTKTFSIIKDLPNLRILHLENDSLKEIPASLFYMQQIESLYLNNNLFNTFPKELKDLKNLKYLDLHDNKFKFQNYERKNLGEGIKIRFE